MRRLKVYSPHNEQRIKQLAENLYIFTALFAEINMWIYNYKNWPSFTWDQDELVAELT
ncbi:MAG: hypothetical protein ACI828_002947, partial [Flavobacteriales bacterium]